MISSFVEINSPIDFKSPIFRPKILRIDMVLQTDFLKAKEKHQWLEELGAGASQVRRNRWTKRFREVEV